jgi:hypothetical protein
MNKERVLQVADVVEKGHHKFNGVHAFLFMPSWLVQEKHYATRKDFEEQLPMTREDLGGHGHECNTAACMAGFTCLVLDYENTKNGDMYFIEDRARHLLDLTYDEARALFTSHTSEQITGPMAAKVMRHFAETGIVNWELAYQDNWHGEERNHGHTDN